MSTISGSTITGFYCILSARRLALSEQNIVPITRSHSDSIEYSRKDIFWLNAMERILAKIAPCGGARFLSFETVRGWFDTTNSEKDSIFLRSLHGPRDCRDMPRSELCGSSFPDRRSFWSLIQCLVCLCHIRKAGSGEIASSIAHSNQNSNRLKVEPYAMICGGISARRVIEDKSRSRIGRRGFVR